MRDGDSVVLPFLALNQWLTHHHNVILMGAPDCCSLPSNMCSVWISNSDRLLSRDAPARLLGHCYYLPTQASGLRLFCLGGQWQ